MKKVIQYVKKLFETNNENFFRSKPIIGRRISFNPEEIGPFGLEQFFTYCSNLKLLSISSISHPQPPRIPEIYTFKKIAIIHSDDMHFLKDVGQLT
jgi:hypothetical protein